MKARKRPGPAQTMLVLMRNEDRPAGRMGVDEDFGHFAQDPAPRRPPEVIASIGRRPVLLRFL